MDFHFDPHELLEALAHWPVLWVLGAGLSFGTAATQIIKKTWLAFMTKPVSVQRYRISVRWLSALTTYGFTLGLWHSVLSHGGLEEWVCAGTGLMSPLVYQGVKALVATRWPDFAHHWGDNGSLPP